MSYSTGMMNKRVWIAKRADETQETFGKSGQPKYELLGDFWAAEDFNRGVKSLREGAFDAYDTVMFRMRWNKDIDRWCLIKYHGKWYQITSFNEDYQENQIQMTAVELANQQVTIVEPTPEPTSNAGTTDETTPATEVTGTETNTPAVNPEQQNNG